MKDFLQWAEDRGYQMPVVEDDAKPTIQEKQMRDTTKSHAYPPQTGRGLYPKGYFNPIAPDNLVYNKD